MYYWLTTDVPFAFENNFLPCCNMNKVHYEYKKLQLNISSLINNLFQKKIFWNLIGQLGLVATKSLSLSLTDKPLAILYQHDYNYLDSNSIASFAVGS